jgi:hypothetical protein
MVDSSTASQLAREEFPCANFVGCIGGISNVRCRSDVNSIRNSGIPTNNWPKFAILKFAPKVFRYSLIGLLALNQNHQKSWPVIPTLKSTEKVESFGCIGTSRPHTVLWWAESGTFGTMVGHSCGSGGSGGTSTRGGRNEDTRRPVICRRRRGKRTFLMFSCL